MTPWCHCRGEYLQHHRDPLYDDAAGASTPSLSCAASPLPRRLTCSTARHQRTTPVRSCSSHAGLDAGGPATARQTCPIGLLSRAVITHHPWWLGSIPIPLDVPCKVISQVGLYLLAQFRSTLDAIRVQCTAFPGYPPGVGG